MYCQTRLAVRLSTWPVCKTCKNMCIVSTSIREKYAFIADVSPTHFLRPLRIQLHHDLTQSLNLHRVPPRSVNTSRTKQFHKEVSSSRDFFGSYHYVASRTVASLLQVTAAVRRSDKTARSASPSIEE